jgi:archaellum component FlaF (FlaF/FlaG flagellin family)
MCDGHKIFSISTDHQLLRYSSSLHNRQSLSLDISHHLQFKMKVFSQLTIAALASYATAASVDVNKRETPLSVKLAASGNSEVKVTLTNNGAKTLNLLSKGTFLDEENPVEKVTMYSAGGSKFQILYIFQEHDFKVTYLQGNILTDAQVPRFPSRVSSSVCC